MSLIAAGITAGSSLLGGLFGGNKKPEVQKWTDSATKQQRRIYSDQLDRSEYNSKLGDTARNQLMGQAEWQKLPEHNWKERSALSMREDGLEGYQGALDDVSALYGDDTYMGQMINDPTGSMAEAYARYENPYQQDVIDTSLAGMDREHMRAMAQRGASAASKGGITNTRSAVADALQQSLHGMDRAELEAQLRSDGFMASRDLGGQEMDRVSMLTGDVADRNMQLADDEWDTLNMYADDLGAFGSENRRIGDVNRENERLNDMEAIQWYNSQFGVSPMEGVAAGGQTMPPSQSGWLQGAGLGANLASAYLKNSAAA